MNKTHKKVWRRFIMSVIAFIMCLTVVGFGYGCKKETPNTATDLEIAYWEAGVGRDFLVNIIDAFKSKNPDINVYLRASADLQTSDLTSGADVNSVDLYFTTMETYLGYKNYLEPLDDILDDEVDGVELRSKFDEDILAQMADQNDGTTYVLPWSSSVCGLVYNATLFEKFGYRVPRTSNELKGIVEEAITKKDQNSANPNPFIHYSLYWNYLLFPWQAQYDGKDAFSDAWQFKYNNEINKVESLTDKNSGRYMALEALYELLSPRGAVYTGANQLSHTNSQTIFLDGQALMMPNGSWVQNEMKNTPSNDTEMMIMKTPVLSAVGTKFGITENALRAVVSYIDGETLTANEQALVDDTDDTVIEQIREVRNIAYTELAQYHSFIPKYAVAKDAAKEFLKFFYSDEAIKIYYNTTHLPHPAKLATGSVNTDNWTEFEKRNIQLYNEQTPIIKALTNPIFYQTGQVYSLYHYNPAASFCASVTSPDRQDINQFWESECSYWTSNWSMLLDLAGITTAG